MVMETFENTPLPRALALGSYQTALCIIPPTDLHPRVDSLRALYDKAYGRWPPHINLIYPFVAVESLPQAVDLIRSKLRESGILCQKINLQLDEADHFSHRHSNTAFIAPLQDSSEKLKTIRGLILDAFKGSENGREYHPHLTIGQTPANAPPMCEYMLDKVRLLLPIAWQVEELVVLVRENMPGKSKTDGCMRIWGSLNLSSDTLDSADSKIFDGREKSHTWRNDGGFLATTNGLAQNLHSYGVHKISPSVPGITYHFTRNNAIWKPVDSLIPLSESEEVSSSLKVSSYNVLHDPSITLCADERYPILLQSILADCALSDVLILQEVSDDFLSYLLSNNTISSHYPFASHTPINPLPSLRNIVVLSRSNFSWEYLSVEQRHKGAVIVQFSNIGMSKGASWKPLILVGVHLSSGMSNSGVAARMSQLQTLLRYLSKRYSTDPWIVAGDFNIASSSVATEEALAMKAISAETAIIIDSLVPMLEDKGLTDTWVTTGGDSEDASDGDAGATFDPMKNQIAAETVRNAGSKNMRPRRYDRIFVKGDDLLEAIDFNMFGLREANSETVDCEGKDSEVLYHYGSDHYGIRATFSIGLESPADMGKLPTFGDHSHTINLSATSPPLSDPSILYECLNKHLVFPSEAQTQHRKDVFDLLNTVLQSSSSQSTSPNSAAQPTITLLPVGSYALETYLPTSDLDILALGAFSASSFFILATRRLQNFKESGVKVLRRVDAATGTMLELEIRGVRCDLQYCCAPAILSRWQEIGDLEPQDPLFQLPIQALQKLNSYRDIEYLKREISDPQTHQFRLAHRFLHVWAQQRGVYAGKFGFLNGFAVTLMLSHIVRHLPPQGDDAAPASSLIWTFFTYYASFDWTADMVHDAAFAVEKKRYRRAAREVMVVLSLHAPRVNVLRAASLPALRTIREELQRAERLLIEPNVTWEGLIGGAVGGVGEFLKAYKSYVKIDVHYWGSSVAQGSSLVGWLESKCVVLLVDLSRKLPGIHTRIWPARFKSRNDESSKVTEEEYQGCYLIGLRRMEGEEKRSIGDSNRKLAQIALRTALESFADRIRGDEKYFDSSNSWVDANHVSQSGLGDLILDERDWGVGIDECHSSDVEHDPEARDKCIDIIFSNDSDDEEVEPSTPKMKSKTSSARKGGRASTKPVSSNKLRPASDILSRLRWDPDLDSSDYVVGYIDRFLGTKEQGLDMWKSEQTDEEFIPQHRIVYFRRKSDDVRVWDRETRSDLIFGSGVGKG